MLPDPSLGMKPPPSTTTPTSLPPFVLTSWSRITGRSSRGTSMSYGHPPLVLNTRNKKRSGVRNLELADSIVMKCLEIIRYFKPRLWCVENPFTGMLKHRSFMSGLPAHRVDYCAYDSNIGMKKSTMIWTNHPSFVPRTCAGRGQCPSMVGRRHRCTCTGSYYDPKWKSMKGRARELARVPHQLICELLCQRTSMVEK